jgi:hypothetical protein
VLRLTDTTLRQVALGLPIPFVPMLIKKSLNSKYVGLAPSTLPACHSNLAQKDASGDMSTVRPLGPPVPCPVPVGAHRQKAYLLIKLLIGDPFHPPQFPKAFHKWV